MMKNDVMRLDATPQSIAWANEARLRTLAHLEVPEAKAVQLRHGKTWFVGLDVLPNAPDGSLGDVAFESAWKAVLPSSAPMHPAQVSIVYPGYPRRDEKQSAPNHSFRVKRCAAHIDGLLPVGPDMRRYPREFHAYVLGIHINECSAAPTVFWPGSRGIVQDVLRRCIGDRPPHEVDVTEAYHAARRAVFERVAPEPLTGPVGSAFLLHRFTLHGTAPWQSSDGFHSEGRMTAFFRPEFATADEWLNAA